MNTSIDIETRALNLLTGLGGDADLVAGSLIEAGVTGVRGHCSRCPIAVHLVAQLDEVDEAGVGDHTVTLFLRDGGGMAEVPIPPAVRAFVGAFDCGHYDDLSSTTPGGEQ